MNKVVELYKQGSTHTEIAAIAGVSLSAVARAIRKARDSGELEGKRQPEPKRTLINMLNSERVTQGTISSMLLSMPKPAQKWVVHNTPDGATVAEFAAAVLMDAYYDEMGDDVT